MARPRTSRTTQRLPPHLYRRPDGRFYFRDPRDGKTYPLGRDERSAVAQAAEANVKLAELDARVRLRHTLAGGGKTLGEWLDEYTKIVKSRTDFSKQTTRQYVSWNGALAGALGDRVLLEMEPEHVGAALAPWIEAGELQKARQVLSHLRRALDACVAAGWLPAGADPTRGVAVHGVRVARQRLTLEGFQAMLALARAGYEPWVARWLEIGVTTCLRISDTLPLRLRAATGASGWWDGQALRVRTAKTGVPVLFPGALHQPGIDGPTIAQIVADVRADGVASAWVLRSSWSRSGVRVGGRIGADRARTVFGELVAKAGIEIAAGKTPPTPHEMRGLGLRLYRRAHGPMWAKMLGAHTSDESAALYQDTRGDDWHIISLPAG